MIEKLGIRPNWHVTEINDTDSIKVDQLHLWRIPLRLNHSQKSVAETLLSDIQRDKYARRATSELQQAYLASRYYLLHLLGAYTGCKPAQIKLTYSRLNKPSLTHHKQNIEFNFTDTTVDGAAHGLFAFTNGHQVGVDLEARSRRSNFEAIIKKRFTSNEIKFVTRPNSNEINPERCLAIWTRKEAYGKATGQGLNFKMNQCDLVSDKPELNFIDQNNEAWRLLQLELGDTLLASVVHAGHQKLSIKAYQIMPDNE